jgi:hypothetical protein
LGMLVYIHGGGIEKEKERVEREVRNKFSTEGIQSI